MKEGGSNREANKKEEKLPWHWLLILSIIVAFLSYLVYTRQPADGLDSAAMMHNQLDEACLAGDASCEMNPSNAAAILAAKNAARKEKETKDRIAREEKARQLETERAIVEAEKARVATENTAGLSL